MFIFKVGETVIVSPILPGLADVAGKKAIVQYCFPDACKVKLVESGLVLTVDNSELYEYPCDEDQDD